jgi:cyclopropane fatty-acyl-phospholipid synthase-like methyltransferase
MKDARSYWDETYKQTPYLYGKAPSQFIVEMLPRLQKGKLLDVAMGEGRNAVYLAQKGFTVRGFDISDVAVTHARNLAKETGVEITAERADLDLYLMGLMEYDSIVMSHFRPVVTRYYTSMISALKQGGTLLIDSLSTQSMDEAISKEESYRNFYFHSNEILKALNGLRILFYQEAMIGDRHVVQCLAQKPIDKDAARLNLFDMHSKSAKDESSKQLELAEKLFKS